MASSALLPFTAGFGSAKSQLEFSRKKSILVSTFKIGSTQFLPAFHLVASRRKIAQQLTTTISIKCEQGTKDSTGLNIWLGRLAMVGFAAAITVEISTGKGVLENFGFTAPLPTLALIITALVGVLTAFFIFQSATRE